MQVWRRFTDPPDSRCGDRAEPTDVLFNAAACEERARAPPDLIPGSRKKPPRAGFFVSAPWRAFDLCGAKKGPMVACPS